MSEVEIPYGEEFFKHIKTYKDVSIHTLKNYPIHLRTFFAFTEGRYNINKKTIQNYTHYLLNEKKDARATVNARLSALRTYFHFLYNEEIIDVDIASKINFVKKESKEPKKIMPQKEIHKILDNITDVKERAICELLYATGIREQECSNLNIDHIDFENELVYIMKGKGKKSRVVPISKTSLKWLKANIGARKMGPLFLNNRNGRLGPRSVYNIVTKYFPFPPHDLRHAFATHLIVKTGNMKGVSMMLGHASESMTEKIYTHISSEHLKDIYKSSGMDDNRK